MRLWLLGRVLHYGWRACVTGSCMFTVHAVMASAGYRIDRGALFAVTVCVILGTRVWAPEPLEPKL